MTKRFACLLTGACLSAIVAPRTMAAGFALHEQSGVAMGTAGAYVAAQGAASIFYNPAGTAALEGLQTEFGLNLLMPSTDFTGPTDHPTFGTSSMESQVFTPVDLYASGVLNERLRWGVGLFTYMGLGTTWAEDWIGRTNTEEINLETITVNPSLATRLGEHTRLGVGLNAMVGIATMSKDSYTGYPFNGYVDVDLEGQGMGFGWNLGLQHDLSDEVSVGLSYRSGMVLAAEGDASFTIQDVENASHQALLASMFPTSDVELDLDIPPILLAGWQIHPKTLLGGRLTWRGDVVWTEWNNYESLDIDFLTETSALKDSHSPKFYQNTLAFRTGVEFNASEQLTLRGGWYYEQNAVQDHLLEPSLPDAERNGISLGASYQMSESLALDAYFIQILLQDRVSTFADVPGAYESSIPAFGFSVRKGF